LAAALSEKAFRRDVRAPHITITIEPEQLETLTMRFGSPLAQTLAEAMGGCELQAKEVRVVEVFADGVELETILQYVKMEARATIGRTLIKNPHYRREGERKRRFKIEPFTPQEREGFDQLLNPLAAPSNAADCAQSKLKQWRRHIERGLEDEWIDLAALEAERLDASELGDLAEACVILARAPLPKDAYLTRINRIGEKLTRMRKEADERGN
jgi:hypothetical protein